MNALMLKPKIKNYWQRSIAPVSFPRVTEDLNTDVVVIGGGIAGVTIAYKLVQSGKRVILIEKGDIGDTDNGKAMSHLLTMPENRYVNLEKVFGPEGISIIAESHRQAINYIEKMIKDENIECEFERLDGYLFLHQSDTKQSLLSELNAVRKVGLNAIDLPFVLGTNQHVPCLKFYDQAQFHPVKYLNGVCDILKIKGAGIYSQTGISKMSKNEITTDGGYRIKTDFIVITDPEFENGKYTSPLHKNSCNTYALAARIKKDSVRKFLWMDTGDKKKNSKIPPCHAVRIQKYDNEYDLLICEGEDQLCDRPDLNDIGSEEHYIVLEGWAREHFQILDVICKWSGRTLHPNNHIGYIGREKTQGRNNLFIVTGDSGAGATQGIIAGMLIPDLICGKENKWEKIYDPGFILPSKSAINIKELFSYVLRYVKNRIVRMPTFKTTGKKGTVLRGNLISKFNNALNKEGNEGIHEEGVTFWNNDEESWDRMNQGKRAV